MLLLSHTRTQVHLQSLTFKLFRRLVCVGGGCLRANVLVRSLLEWQRDGSERDSIMTRGIHGLHGEFLRVVLETDKDHFVCM